MKDENIFVFLCTVPVESTCFCLDKIISQYHHSNDLEPIKLMSVTGHSKIPMI